MIERLFRAHRLAGLAVVIGLHGLVFAALVKLPAPVAPAGPAPVFVSIIEAVPPSAAPQPRRESAPMPPRPPVAPVAQPAAQPVPATPAVAAAPAAPTTAATPVIAPAVAEAVPPAAPPAAVAAAPQMPVAPLALGGELEVVCADRPPPAYPLAARRRGVAGRVVLQVELDEAGRIAAVATLTGSGSRWLDEAAREAVTRWRCAPPQQGGVARRVLAKQTFIFSLEDA